MSGRGARLAAMAGAAIAGMVALGAGSIEAGPFWPQAVGCLTRSIVLNGSASDNPGATANPAITTLIPSAQHVIFHNRCGRERMLSVLLSLNQRKYGTGIRDGGGLSAAS